MSFYDELLENKNEDIKFCGVLTGIVKENYNDENPGKVKVEFFAGEEGKNETGWIRVASPYAGNGNGVYMLPEIGSEVLVAFEQGDKDCPIVIGSLWNVDNTIPNNAVTEENTVKMIKTKGGHEIIFGEEEDKGQLQIITPGKLKVTLSDEKKTITTQDSEGNNKVIVDGENGKITLDGKEKIILSIGGTAALTIDGSEKKVTCTMDNINIEASQALTLKGQSVKLNGSQIEIKADGSLKVESGGMAEVKGSMVKIN